MPPTHQCLFKYSWSQSYISKQVKGACESINMYVFCLFPPPFSAVMTTLAPQWQISGCQADQCEPKQGSEQIFSPGGEWGCTLQLLQKILLPSWAGNSSFSPSGCGLRPLACLVIFFNLLSSLMMMNVGKFWASWLMSWFHKILASLTQKWRLEVKLVEKACKKYRQKERVGQERGRKSRSSYPLLQRSFFFLSLI